MQENHDTEVILRSPVHGRDDTVGGMSVWVFLETLEPKAVCSHAKAFKNLFLH